MDLVPCPEEFFDGPEPLAHLQEHGPIRFHLDMFDPPNYRHMSITADFHVVANRLSPILIYSPNIIYGGIGVILESFFCGRSQHGTIKSRSLENGLSPYAPGSLPHSRGGLSGYTATGTLPYEGLDFA